MNEYTFLGVLIIGVPIAALVLLVFFNTKLPRWGDWLATAAMGFALLLSLYLFKQAWTSPEPLNEVWSFDWINMGQGYDTHVEVWSPERGGLVKDWETVGAHTISTGMRIDNLTAVMLVVVTLISFLVLLFSMGYMHGDARYGRYYAYLVLFAISMLGLVLTDNLLHLYVFWEIMGLSSYLLIGHYFEKDSANYAAKKAFIVTRIGDIGMFIGIMIIYWKAGTFRYDEIFQAVADQKLYGLWQFWAGIGIFMGAVGKSAQFPLHVWLPDAMEGPTPVSCLIHAATMVAAGVYLTARMLPMFTDGTLLFIAYTGAITAAFAAVIAIVQDDIKKVLAYSTVSQLGYMIMALGVGGYVAGLFHLTTHAIFKGCLFLCSGAVIHAMHHEQSMAQYGGLAKKLPITFAAMLASTCAIAGVPFFSGFFSKDAILAESLYFGWTHSGHLWLFGIGLATAGITAFYMFRLIFLTFAGKPRDARAHEHAHEVGFSMAAPLVILGFLALVAGWPEGGKWFGRMNAKPELPESHMALAAAPAAHEHDLTPGGGAGAEAEFSHQEDYELQEKAHHLALYTSVPVGLFGILVAGLFYFPPMRVFDPARVRSTFPWLYNLLWNKFYVDEMYEAVFVRPLYRLIQIAGEFDRRVIDGIVNFIGWACKVAAFVVGGVDKFVVDGIVNGTAWGTHRLGALLSRSQTGRLRQYLFFIVGGAIVLCVVFVFAR